MSSRTCESRWQYGKWIEKCTDYGGSATSADGGNGFQAGISGAFFAILIAAVVYAFFKQGKGVSGLIGSAQSFVANSSSGAVGRGSRTRSASLGEYIKWYKENVSESASLGNSCIQDGYVIVRSFEGTILEEIETDKASEAVFGLVDEAPLVSQAEALSGPGIGVFEQEGGRFVDPYLGETVAKLEKYYSEVPGIEIDTARTVAKDFMIRLYSVNGSLVFEGPDSVAMITIYAGRLLRLFSR